MFKQIKKFVIKKRRMLVIGLLIIIQVVFMLTLIYNASLSAKYLSYGLTVLSYIMVFVLLDTEILPEFKISWIVLFFIVPLFGGLFYLLFGTKYASKKFIDEMGEAEAETRPYMQYNRKVEERLWQRNSNVYKQMLYLKNCAYAPVYEKSTTKYLSPGEEKFDYLKRELEEAEHYIFLEYFILEQGVMWNEILEILERKAKEGVDVRLMYDDIGSLNTLPRKYALEIEKRGIKCKVFNPFTASVNVIANHRDHRKIVVIDGHTAFTGGINLADEYINVKERFGYWKDSSIMIKGEAVWSFTVMFLQFWNVKEAVTEDFEQFKPKTGSQAVCEDDGFVQPYADSPVDDEPVGERVYFNLIHGAKQEILIYTPYLIVDSIMIESLCLAAKSGVDVKIVVPHIPDKKIPFLLTRSNYEHLLKAGVQIYEYTPGFIHSKCVLCDGEVGAIGTVNLDYRSFYHHFECGVWMYKSNALKELKLDFEKTLDMSQKVTMKFVDSAKWYIRVMRKVIKVFAPLM